MPDLGGILEYLAGILGGSWRECSTSRAQLLSRILASSIRVFSSAPKKRCVVSVRKSSPGPFHGWRVLGYWRLSLPSFFVLKDPDLYHPKTFTSSPLSPSSDPWFKGAPVATISWSWPQPLATAQTHETQSLTSSSGNPTEEYMP